MEVNAMNAMDVGVLVLNTCLTLPNSSLSFYKSVCLPEVDILKNGSIPAL